MIGTVPGEAASKLSIGSVAPTVAAQQAAAAAAQQAAAAATQAQGSLARAAEALAAAQRLQGAAAAAGSSSSVPNGLVAGGLVPTDPTYSTNLWIGANAPVQTTSGSQVTVDIQQTQQKALLYWNSFNVGANTTVNFEQQSSNWIALNRVNNSTSPSQIFGNIHALGAVYLINSNGIIFGSASQVNVNTLVASSLDIGVLGSSLAARDQYFLNTGIANLNSFSFYDWATQGSATSNAVAGDITVQRGAKITANIATDLVPQGSPGDIYLFGANVYNSGWLNAATGEIGMVAARTIDLVPSGYSALPTSVLGTDSSGNPLTFRGTEFTLSQFAAAYSNTGYPNRSDGGGSYLPGTGAVVHDGLIEASRGIVIMDGDKVAINNPKDANGNSLTDAATGALVQGVVSVDTSIDRNSFVMLRAATSVTMNGVITALPFDDGSSPLPMGGSSGSAVQSFTPPYIEMTAQSTVTLGPSGLISAPSAAVALRVLDFGSDASILYQPTANNQLFNQGGNLNTLSGTNVAQNVVLSPGGIVDVAGLENVTLPASYNVISFQPRAEFADMPVQRNGVLFGQTLYINILDSGTRSDGTSWVGTPLANASGYVNAVGRSISQLMTTGGSVTLQTDLTSGSGVRTAGSIINVAGGSEQFLPGMVPTTVLLGADGRLYNIANADPSRVYVGIANQFTVNHSRWGIEQTWSWKTFSPGYNQGEDAGSVSVTTLNPVLQGGTIYFGSVAGQLQLANGQLPAQGSFTLTTPSSVQIGSSASADYTTQSANVTNLSADTLSGYGLSSLKITANDVVVSKGSTLNLAPGGSFSLVAGGAIDIAGTVSAAGGSVSLTTDRLGLNNSSFFSLSNVPTNSVGQQISANVYVEGTIDVSGRFVNDTGRYGSNLTGPADINGGSINIATTTISNLGNEDWTGSILLAKGSLLDVSSGGYVSSQGTSKAASSGVMAGKAGSISLSIYQANVFNPSASIKDNLSSPQSGHVAVIELDGGLRGYGFESNGSLTISGVDNIQIGGSLPAGATSNIVIGDVPASLPVSLFTDGGFGSYTIQSVADGWTGAPATITVAAGVNLTLGQLNFQSPIDSTVDYSTVATGTKLGQQASRALAMLPADLRQSVNLTLNAANVLLDTGSAILTDPTAKITIGNVANINGKSNISEPAASVMLLGSITDHGGSVFINATATQLGSQALVDLSGTFLANSTFGLLGGSQVSGTYLPGGMFTVESATQKTISGTTTYDYTTNGTSGTLVAFSGAEVDVSGAAGAVQFAGPHGSRSSVWSWSDAGTFSADVTGFAWGGSFAAAGGRYVGADGKTHADSRANNATVVLSGGAINLSQDTTAFASVLSNFQQQGTLPQSIYVAANQLAPFDNVYLYAGTAPGGATRVFTDLNGNIYGFGFPGFAPLTIQGSVNLSVANRLHIAASGISPLSADPINVDLTAPYIELTGGGGNTFTGNSTLSIRAQTIDIEGAVFSGFSLVNLISSGDIRLSTVKVANGSVTNNGVPVDAESFTGSLTSAGNLLFSAQRIFPLSAVTFDITAGTATAPANVTFTAPAGSNTAIPLAAGGGIDVIASTIDQGGNLFAPLGQIALGNTNTATSSTITQSVTLEPGSLTSVTLANTVVPYGATIDGTNWYYNASLSPLTQLPSKGVVLAGANVNVTQGSTIDLRGGGDLQALEWIAGKGGSVDTLQTTANGPTVYALVPTANAAVAAYDIQFATARSFDNGITATAGDINPIVGSQVTIAGGGGIAAGIYTLYPAHYATLPGAMRVVVYESNDLGRRIPSGTILTDGTVLVTGNLTQSTAPGKQSSGETVFAVRTNAVWQTYSEYQFTSADSYFRTLAAKNGSIIPVPFDAGNLQVIASQTLNLNGTFLADPAKDSNGAPLGNGGELDIAATQGIEIVGDTQYASGDIKQGYVGIDVSQLDKASFDSILIGGLRSPSGSATLVTPLSAGVLVDLHSNVLTGKDELTAPEIVLVATPQMTTASQSAAPVPVAGTGNVTIAAGSVIKTTGIVHEASGRNYYFGALPGTAANSVVTVLGGTLDSTGTVITGATGTLSSASQALQSYLQSTTGAMFVATNDATLNASGPAGTPLTIQFAAGGSAVVTADAGRVVMTPGASIQTNALTLQATASTNAIAINSTDLAVGQMKLAAQTIALGSISPVTNTSLALSNFEFTGVGELTLKALSGVISVYGDYNPGISVSGLTLDAAALVQAPGAASAQISASGTITLLNSGIATSLTSPLATPQTTLALNAGQIVLGNTSLTSAQTILGYANVDLNASERVVIAGPGSLTLGYNNKNSDGTFTFADAVNLNVATPLVMVTGASGTNDKSFAISAGGSLAILDTVPQVGFGAQPFDSPQVGGSLTVTASDIRVGTVIQAQAGTISLEAMNGDLTLLPRANLFAGGFTQTLVDVTSYIAGGKVVLQADAGNVNVSAFSIVDVAQPAGGLGYGGEVDVIALNGNATVSGLLLGGGGPGHGGTFKLDSLGAVDLGHFVVTDGNGNQSITYQLQSLQPGQTESYQSGLADQLLFGGFTGGIDIHTRTGNIVLAQGHTLKANTIALTADDPAWDKKNPAWDPSNPSQLGQVQIYGSLDASGYGGTTSDGAGEAGGQVALYGANAVLLASTGVIDASTTHADRRGGDVTVGIGWSAQAKIYLQAFTQIDVSGGTQGGLSGGTVKFVAPNDGNNDMKIAALSPASNIELPSISGINISGARSVTFDSYVAFDTTASGSKYGIDAAGLGWNGIVDPAGWYNSNGTLAASGTWSNVAGWVISSVPTTLFASKPNVAAVGNAQFALDMGVYWPTTGLPFTQQVQNGNVILTPTSPSGSPVTIPVGLSGTVTFSGATTSGMGATATWSTTQSGGLSITVQNHGSGYTQAASSLALITSDGQTTYSVSLRTGLGGFRSLATLGINSLTVQNVGSGFSGSPSSSTLAVKLTDNSSGTSSTATLTEGFGSGTYSDQNGQVSFTPIQNNFIPFTSSGVFNVFNPATQNTPGIATFTGNTPDNAFFATTLAQYAQGSWSYNGQSYGFSNLFNRLEPLVNQLGAAVVQVQPGVQLVNSSQTVNSGNITVANNWNLASGTAYNLQQSTNPVTNQTFQYFDPVSSYVSLNYRLVTPWKSVDAGSLSLRAIGDINVGGSGTINNVSTADVSASISDGFFQFGNYLDPSYVAWVASYLYGNGSTPALQAYVRSLSNNYAYYLNGYSATSVVPVAPYDPFANAISPSSQNLTAMDLFPNSLNVCVSACGTSSANLIKVTGPSSWSYALTAGADLGSANPTARISLVAANKANTGDVVLADHSSYTQPLLPDPTTTATVNQPTMVRTGTGDITVAAARDVVMQDTTAPGVIYAAGVNTPLLPDPNYGGSSIVVAGNPSGFLEPQVLGYGTTTNGGSYYGAPTAAAFPEMGGDVRVDAQRDIIGYSGSGNKVPQYYQPWLLADSDLTPVQSLAARGSAAVFGSGVFTPSGSSIASQTAWWIQYSSFQQGILSAGGNVTVVAGRNLIDVSVSLPTTGRVSGGLSASSTPVTYDYGSGNMVVRAGGDILGGSFYEGSGYATIFAGGTIGQNGTVSRSATSKFVLPDLPLLAVDTGTIAMASLGSLSVAGVINPAELQAQSPSLINPLDSAIQPSQVLYFDTYGPLSGVNLVAVTGDLTIAIAPTAIGDFSNTSSPIQAVPAVYPASLQALALNGNLVTTGIQTVIANPSTARIQTPGIVLSPSDHGAFELLAQGSVDLTFGFPDNTQLLARSPRPYISAGSALIDTGFNPFQPNSGFDGSSSAALLAHADDAQAGIDATARIFAVTGSIKATGNFGPSIINDATNSYQIAQINRPAEIFAGTDIIDLNVIIQNIHPTDVSTITAGRNITYSGNNNGGGIEVAGPGFLVVQAGGDIGPFLPANVDNKVQAQVQEGIASVGNASATPVGDIFLPQFSVGIYDQALFGAFAKPRRNTELTAAAGTSQGASIDVLFGIKSPPDYQAVINNYINPATAGSDQGFAFDLGGFPVDAQTAWKVFQSYSPAQQHAVIYELFFAILKDVAKNSPTTTTCPQVCEPAFQVIKTLFPSGQSVNANELNLLHATIQTRLGGDVSIFGPGGGITVGSLANEPNPNLRLRDLGILTLGGGNINTYTDGSVLVNSSRVLTTQGGDVLMWSSFGDLDAGRGSKTIVSAPALQVQFDQNDYETIDPGGFVTGSGIGTLQASSNTPPGNLYLVAPNGTIDFGTAGVRASGNALFVAPVISNASNFVVGGTATGVPSVPSLSSSTAQSANTAQSKPDVDATKSGPSDQASVFIVEVVGYGSGDSGSPAAPQQSDDAAGSEKRKPAQ
jgi:filamentous hemagglutinin family protein